MRLLIDMNLSPRWAAVLCDAGFDAVHWSTVGKAIADDREIVAAARQGGHVVLTHDLDFGTILAVSRVSKPSVVQLRAGDVSPEAAAPAVIAALRQCRGELESGALLTVDASRFRVSLLPLGH